MRFSWKVFLISFVPALVLFSLVMTLICDNAFDERVPVWTDDERKVEGSLLPTDPRIYYCMDPRDDTLQYAAMIFTDAATGEKFVIPVEGGQLVTYKNAMYFVKTLYEQEGSELLCLLFESLVGVHTDVGAVKDARDLLPNGKKHTHLRVSDLVELLASAAFSEETELEVLSPVLVAHNEYKWIDIAETRTYFGTR